MDTSTLWMKTAHQLRSMSDEKFISIEKSLLDLFGGTKKLFQSLLAKQEGIEYDKLMQMKTIIEANTVCSIMYMDVFDDIHNYTLVL